MTTRRGRPAHASRPAAAAAGATSGASGTFASPWMIGAFGSGTSWYRGAIDEVRVYDRLFNTPSPNDVPEGTDWKTGLNPDSLKVLTGCMLEPSLKDATEGRYQFERLGYFCVDTEDSTPQRPVFNRIVSLKDSWAKLEATEPAAKGAPRKK